MHKKTPGQVAYIGYETKFGRDGSDWIDIPLLCQSGWEAAAQAVLINPWLDLPDGPGYWLVQSLGGFRAEYFKPDDFRDMANLAEVCKGRRFQRIIGEELLRPGDTIDINIIR